MNYYQARISIETARLLEKMRRFYEEEMGGAVTKGNCLIKSYYDSLWVKDWKEIFEIPTPSISESDYQVSPTGQLLKVQITDEVKNGIQDLKTNLPKLIGARYVTVGVCIREILKAAYLKNINTAGESHQTRKVREIINREKIQVRSNFDENVQDDVLNLLDNLELQILDAISKKN
ncbi:TPA: hypothetical protein ACF351_001291 [Clostridium perfringens]|uniref:hypothetical protein n=1 Tax=Clostridium perfringens TaxID=1502 RepID=UPI0024BD18B0|nr:hypothetical protein [Clostridium perfringens]MDM0627010.1 hypothetical protein [Clostridium perfringens]